MIVDSHAYCFTPADSIRGYSSIKEHLQWIQAGQADHYQPAFRIGDRALGPSEVLAPAGSEDLDLLPDLGFRIDHEVGRVVWTVDGDDYTKHYYPPNLRNVEFSPFNLIGKMDLCRNGCCTSTYEPYVRS